MAERRSIEHSRKRKDGYRHGMIQTIYRTPILWAHHGATPKTIDSSDVAFTPSVKSVQSRKGSREAYARVEERGGWETRITPELAQFIAAQTSVFLATVSAEGQPYIQHRGGPPGFLHVLDDRTIACPAFAGNRQYITQGNL